MTSAIVNTGHQIPDEHREAADRALEVLLDPALEPIVDMVLTRRDDRYEALAASGRVTFERTENGDFVEVSQEGRNPLADQSTDKFVGLDDELAQLHPHRDANAYPFAYAQTAQLFDSPAAPDLCVIHSAAHNWEDQGGHLGEHGSIGIVQARAPMVIGGKGVKSLGLIPARPAWSTPHRPSPRSSAARRAPTATTSRCKTVSHSSTCSTRAPVRAT